jgi:hypothetical protein
MKDIIEQLNSLQIGDLVWWTEEGDGSTVIGIVTQLSDDLNGDYFWKAEFPQDGEHCYYNEEMEEYVEDGMLGVVCKSEI